MLDAPKSLFFGSGHQHTVAHQRRRGIGVKGIEAKDVHKKYKIRRTLRAVPEPVTVRRAWALAIIIDPG